jgi:hypothetical protein
MRANPIFHRQIVLASLTRSARGLPDLTTAQHPAERSPATSPTVLSPCVAGLIPHEKPAVGAAGLTITRNDNIGTLPYDPN